MTERTTSGYRRLVRAATAERIRAAVERVENDPQAGTRKGSHTNQTRRLVAALRAIGVPRSDFSARVGHERRQGATYYLDASADLRTAEARQIVADNAQALVDGAGLRVFIIGGHPAFVATGGQPGVKLS